MNGLRSHAPSLHAGYWLAKIHSVYKFHESSALIADSSSIFETFKAILLSCGPRDRVYFTFETFISVSLLALFVALNKLKVTTLLQLSNICLFAFTPCVVQVQIRIFFMCNLL